MRKLLLVSIVISFTVTCKKDNNQLSYPSVYYANGIRDIQPLRAFTVNGEIKNKEVTDRIEINSLYFTPEDLKNLPPAIDSIQFASASVANLFGLYINDRVFGFSQNGNDLILTDLSAGSVERDTFVANKIALSCLYYPELISNKRNPSGPFYWYDFTEQHFATLTSANELIIPTMVTMIPAPFGVTYFSRPINNRFNPGFNLKLLGPGDTFAVREYSLVMQKAP